MFFSLQCECRDVIGMGQSTREFKRFGGILTRNRGISGFAINGPEAIPDPRRPERELAEWPILRQKPGGPCAKLSIMCLFRKHPVPFDNSSPPARETVFQPDMTRHRFYRRKCLSRKDLAGKRTAVRDQVSTIRRNYHPSACSASASRGDRCKLFR